MMKGQIKILLLASTIPFILMGCLPREQFNKTDLLPACHGGRSPSASSFPGIGVPGIHPIVIVYESGENHPWNGLTESNWYPKTIAELQLVACVKPIQQELVEVCLFPDRDFPYVHRIRYYVNVGLVVARTGKTIASETFWGSEPTSCEKSSPNEIYGTEVDFNEVHDWLGEFVEP